MTLEQERAETLHIIALLKAMNSTYHSSYIVFTRTIKTLEDRLNEIERELEQNK